MKMDSIVNLNTNSNSAKMTKKTKGCFMAKTHFFPSNLDNLNCDSWVIECDP